LLHQSLVALPVPSLGTKLDDESLWIALGLRLCVPIVAEHTCICGAVVNVFGSRGLSCNVVVAVFHCTLAINETVRCALVSGGIPAVLEPVGLCRNDGKRPDGMSLIPWRQGLLVRILLPHLMCLLLLEVPAGWQTLRSQPSLRNIPA